MCYLKKKEKIISQLNWERRNRFWWKNKLAKHCSSIIFSYETKIVLGKNNKIYVLRKADDRLRLECLGVRGDRETTCASVMFWGCITFYGLEALKAIKGNTNSFKYIDLLDEYNAPCQCPLDRINGN